MTDDIAKRRLSPTPEAEMLLLDNIQPLDDKRPFGRSTSSARSFWLDGVDGGEAAVSLAPSGLVEGAFELIAGRVVNFGLPLQRIQVEAALAPVARAAVEVSVDAYVPAGFPVAYHPKIATSASQRIGRRASGARLRLFECEAELFGGESRSFVFPDAYPYSSVCKLIVEGQQVPGGPWSQQRRGTGFLVGRRLLMTSGHMRPNPGGHAWRVKVIPACWQGYSVFGCTFFTFVRQFHSWFDDDDAGSDLMIGELYDPIGDDLGYFGATNYSANWQDLPLWTLCGFPCDRGSEKPSRQTGISVRDDDDGNEIRVPLPGPLPFLFDTTEIECDADIASGASGSPLFGWSGGGATAIGALAGPTYDATISGTETWACAAGGTGFVQIIRIFRELWD